MKSLLRVVACLSLCVSLNSFGAQISFSSGISSIPQVNEVNAFEFGSAFEIGFEVPKRLFPDIIFEKELLKSQKSQIV